MRRRSPCTKPSAGRNAEHVLDRMQSRADLYKYLDYHAYEERLDRLFAEGKAK